ncbi:Serine phosphatase RsbU, regulator of sigma subunit [Olavius sp. associated proteobacterium Delta 1]|nr:Serine phosphatase RsbU, regulator of sigma subunit [Olavius sp. associated proteobacterium Delta 1]
MRLANALNRKIKKIQEFFYLYTRGLNHREIELLLKKDAVGAYTYLKGKTRLPDHPAKRLTVKTVFFVAKEIFISFMMQLTPARRLFYGLGIAGFLVGLFKVDLFYILISFVILNLLLVVELVDKLTTRDELEIAREIQLSLQPVNIPESHQLSIATYSKPAKMVGGDFFDIVQPTKDRIISIVGDVADKGVSAALYAAYTQSMFQSFSQTSISPAAIFQSVNELICKRMRDGDFITAVIAFFDLAEKSVTIARAGHNWPLYYCADTRTITELKPNGMSIGMFENIQFAERLEEQKIYLQQGDLLLLYSDGVTEATNSENLMFEVAGLKMVITESAHESSEMLIGHINSKLQSFVNSDELQDDATMVAIKVK